MEFLPLFPLELVVFPGEKIRLHIFEPRYKELIYECHEDGKPFGIPTYVEGGISRFGGEVVLAKIVNIYEDGEMDIEVEGRGVFRLERFIKDVPDRLYSAGEVVFIENDARSYPVTLNELANQFRALHELLRTGMSAPELPVKNLSFQVAQHVGLSLPQKIKLLSIPKESDRQLMLIEHLHRVIPIVREIEDTRRRAGGNGKFHKFPEIDLK